MVNAAAMRTARCSAGYSYMEMIVALTVISLLVAIAIDRLMPLQVDAERTALESTVGALRSALGIKVAEYLSSGNARELPSIAGSNPMELLAEQPKNYVGARSGVALGEVDGGRWYFDTDSRLLVYRVLNDQTFVGDLTPYANIKFKVELVFADMNGNQTFDPGVDGVSGARLAAQTLYHWTDPRKLNPVLEK